MTVPQPAAPRTAATADHHVLLRLRARYQDHALTALYTDQEIASLFFLKWLYQTGRLIP